MVHESVYEIILKNRIIQLKNLLLILYKININNRICIWSLIPKEIIISR